MMLTATAAIKQSGHDVIQARDGKEALLLYLSENPDMVLLDVEMPELNGFEVAKNIRAYSADKWIPIIFLTGYKDDDHLAQGINAGGDDYLTKPISNLVLNAKLKAMQRIFEIQNKLFATAKELSETNRKLEHCVITDALTGSYNRLYLDDITKREWYRGMRNKSELSVLIIDVDNFKILNDSNGHLIGDQCLIELAKIIKLCLKRAADVLCRFGGDEFVVVLPDTPTVEAMKIAETIKKNIEQFSTQFNPEVPVTISASIGCASCIPNHEISLYDFLDFADKALYAAKHAGRNCVSKANIPSNKDIAA